MTAFEFTTVSAVDPSTRFSSAAVEVTLVPPIARVAVFILVVDSAVLASTTAAPDPAPSR